MKTSATFVASKFAEGPLFGESGEKFQQKQTEFASRVAKVAILPFGLGLVLRRKRCRACRKWRILRVRG